MPEQWEESFSSWAHGPRKTEQTKCENAEKAIRDAIALSASLKNRNIRVFTQGSYRNKTNVRQVSDVDICVLCSNTFYFHLPDGITRYDVGINDATYEYETFKEEVEKSLISRFGRRAVSRGNQAFDVHENTYRVDADVIACFEYRQYWDRINYITGTCFLPDNKEDYIVNWPDQHYANGVKKNEVTRRRFKRIVRILKTLRNFMVEQGWLSEDSAPGYFIECLLWNVPNLDFGQGAYNKDVLRTLVTIFVTTHRSGKCGNWMEVNQLKHLFNESQPWSVQDAQTFAHTALDFLGFV